MRTLDLDTLKAICTHVARELGPYMLVGCTAGWGATPGVSLSIATRLMTLSAIAAIFYLGAVALYATVAKTRLRINENFAKAFESSTPEARVKLIMGRSN